MEKKKIIGIVLFAFTIVCAGTILITRNWEGLIDPKPHPSRNISTLTKLEEAWGDKDIFVGGKTVRGSKGFLEVTEDAIFSLNVTRSILGQDWILRKQQLDNGEILWEKNFIGPVRATEMDNNNIFVITSKQVTCGWEWEPECESIIVTRYDAIDGNEVWTKTYNGLLNIELVEVNGSAITIHGSANHSNLRATYKIDVTNGNLLQSTDSQYGIKEIVDRFTNSQSLPDMLEFTPLSNIVSQDGFIYFVSDEGQLLMIPEGTNTVFASAQFVPNEFLVPPKAVTVLVGKSKIVVYFEDSRQLFTFDILLDM